MKFEKHAFSCRRDALTIRGHVYLPRADGSFPAVIISHGFMANQQSVQQYAEAMANEGYAAFIYDFCGGCVKGTSDGANRDMTVFTEVADLKAVIAHVLSQPFVRGDRLILMGCSQGGFVSAMTAAQLPETVEKLILFYPALCIPDDARTGKMMFFRFDPQNIPDVLGKWPMELGGNYARSVIDKDPYALIAGYPGPVLIVHGTADKVVARSYAEKAYRMYLESQGGAPSANCQLVYVDKGNHGLRGLKSRAWFNYSFFVIQKFLEGKTPVLNIDVRLTGKEKTKLDKGRKVKAGFEGISEGMYFTGKVRSGAYDEQIYLRGGQPDSCHAVYDLDGVDYVGSPCSIHICNDMPSGGTKDWNRGWIPRVTTDDPALSFLNDQQCETYAEMRLSGPFIHIFAKK